MEEYGEKESKVKRMSVTKDGVTKELKITKAENGFIVCITTSCMEGEEYKVDTKHWISKKDPMPEKEKKGTKEDDGPKTISEALKSINF